MFSNKKKKYKQQQKKIQLCTAFGYNCFSIKSLLFWKEPFLTSAGGMGQRRVPWQTRFGAAAGTGAVVFGLAMPGEALLLAAAFSSGPFVPAQRLRSLPSGRTDGWTEPGARREPPRRGGPDGEYRTGAAQRPVPLACIAGSGQAVQHRAACWGNPGVILRHAGLSPLSSVWVFGIWWGFFFVCFFLYF